MSVCSKYVWFSKLSYPLNPWDFGEQTFYIVVPELATILKKDPWRFLSFQLKIHLRRPRGGQLDREKRRRKFSRTGERALGMLRLTNKFHGSFECSLTGNKKKILCPIGGQHRLSCCSSDLLIRRSLPVNSTVCRTCLARTRELSSRRVFSENTENKEIP